MIGRGICLGLMLFIAACGPRDTSGVRSGPTDVRNEPSNTTPGIHISGHAKVGVVSKL